MYKIFGRLRIATFMLPTLPTVHACCNLPLLVFGVIPASIYITHLSLRVKTQQDALTKAQEAQYSEVAAILKSACPTVAPSTAPGRAWLDAFAASLKKELEAKKVTSSPVSTQKDDAKLEEMRAQNQHLQGLVDKYKTIIDDTVSACLRQCRK